MCVGVATDCWMSQKQPVLFTTKDLACQVFWFGFLFHAWARRALNHAEETVM
jgi:hypothetical protein